MPTSNPKKKTAPAKAPAKAASKPPKAATSRAGKKSRRRAVPETVEIPGNWISPRDMIELAEIAKERGEPALAGELAAVAVAAAIGEPAKKIVVPLRLLDNDFLDHFAWMADEHGDPATAKILAAQRVKNDEIDDPPPAEKPLELVEVDLHDVGAVGALRLFLRSIEAESSAAQRLLPLEERAAHGLWVADTEKIRACREVRRAARRAIRAFLARPAGGVDRRKIRVPADWREEIELSGPDVFFIPARMLTAPELLKIGERMTAAGFAREAAVMADFGRCPDLYQADRSGNESEG